MSGAITRGAAVRRYRPVIRDDTRRTILWLAGAGLTVTLLTSNALWRVVFNVFDAERRGDGQVELVAPPAPAVDRELARLIRLTETPETAAPYAPEKAITLNAAIPFSHEFITPARSFAATSANEGAKLTALKCLTQAVYYEAAYEPLSGRRAVAQVVLNRAAHPAFPKSVCGVVYQGVNQPVCQFSFTCDGSLKRRPNAAVWKEAETVALAALNGYVEPSVGYSTHYHANYVSPYWAPKLVKLTKIGAHIFYRWPGRWGMPGAFSGHYSGVEAIPAIMDRGTAAPAPGMAAGVVGGDGVFSAEQLALQDRRADDDTGGRLDTTRGWTLAIPAPEEVSHAARLTERQQGGEIQIGNKEGGS